MSKLYILWKKKKKLSIKIWCDDDRETEDFVKGIIEDLNLFDKIKVRISYIFPNKGVFLDTNILIIFGKPGYSKNININDLVFQFLNRNLFLVFKINFWKEKHSSGLYKIKNNIEEYKKLLLFLSIINVICKK